MTVVYERSNLGALYMLALWFRRLYKDYYSFDFKLWLTTADFFPLLCTLALGLSSVNFVRVAAETSAFGVPYLLLYSVLTLLLGLPIALLELGLGQFCQQGAAAVWRAVPAMRGPCFTLKDFIPKIGGRVNKAFTGSISRIAFVKLLCTLVYALVSGVQAALVAAYAVRSGAANLPISECSQLTMTEHGYFQNNTFGLECAERTFLKPYNEDSFWFSIMCIVIFIVWIIVPVCIYCLETSYKYSLCILATVISILCLTLAVATGQSDLVEIFEDPHWEDVGSSRLWFAAVWQVLLSSRIGLAYLDTTGGTVYFRSHSIRCAVTLVIVNLIISWLGVLIWFSITPGVTRDSSILAVPIWVYDSAVVNDKHRAWPCLAFIALLLSTIATMITLLYPIFNSLSKSFKYQWRLSALLLIVAAMASSMALFVTGLDALTFLERFAVPLVVCVLLFVEIVAFMFIYGWKNVRSDLEFMLGNGICIAWVGWWTLAAVLVLGVAIWEVCSVVEDGWPWINDSMLELGLLVALAAVGVFTVLVWAVLVIVKQEEYDSLLKIKSSFNPSRKWGPDEPILRHLWIQWTSNAHSPDLVNQIHTNRRGVTAAILQDTNRSDSSASRKSSLEEYESRKSSYDDYAGSKKSSSNSGSKKSSLEEIGSYKRPSLDLVHGRASKLSSEKSHRSSRMSSFDEVPVREKSGGEKSTAPSIQDNVYYGQIRQMYY